MSHQESSSPWGRGAIPSANWLPRWSPHFLLFVGKNFLLRKLIPVIRSQLGNPASTIEGEQMRAAGEGEIYNAQREKTGFGEQGDLAAGLDRKREEQDRIKEERGQEGGEGELDVEAALSGRGKGFVGVSSGSGGRGVAE